MPGFHVVTGAFGYTGRYIAQRLLEQGMEVRTLTGRPARIDPLSAQVPAHPFNFDRPDLLTESLRGAEVLYNTYWIRFARGPINHERATENLRILFRAAGDAGVQRVVHVSITNARVDSDLPYFRGKALVEEHLRTLGLSYAILRPTVVFGREDILMNNIAWFLRRFPVFPIPGSGLYRLQPVYVDDMAELAVSAGESRETIEMDAVGPEVFSFHKAVELLRDVTGSRSMLVRAPSRLALLASQLASPLVRDVVLTRDEVEGLARNLLVSHGEPTASTRFSEWIADHGASLGAQYASELQRHYVR